MKGENMTVLQKPLGQISFFITFASINPMKEHIQ